MSVRHTTTYSCIDLAYLVASESGVIRPCDSGNGTAAPVRMRSELADRFSRCGFGTRKAQGVGTCPGAVPKTAFGSVEHFFQNILKKKLPPSFLR